MKIVLLVFVIALLLFIAGMIIFGTYIEHKVIEQYKEAENQRNSDKWQ